MLLTLLLLLVLGWVIGAAAPHDGACEPTRALRSWDDDDDATALPPLLLHKHRAACWPCHAAAAPALALHDGSGRRPAEASAQCRAAWAQALCSACCAAILLSWGKADAIVRPGGVPWAHGPHLDQGAGAHGRQGLLLLLLLLLHDPLLQLPCSASSGDAHRLYARTHAWQSTTVLLTPRHSPAAPKSARDPELHRGSGELPYLVLSAARGASRCCCRQRSVHRGAHHNSWSSARVGGVQDKWRSQREWHTHACAPVRPLNHRPPALATQATFRHLTNVQLQH